MKLIEQISDTERIAYKFNFDASGKVFCLQRKRGRRWRTKAWTYASIHSTYQEVKEYLYWEENRKRRTSEKGAFEKIISSK